MKRCPECRRDYTDETLLYCLEDGSVLLDGPFGIHSTAAPSAEPATVMLHSTEPPYLEAATHFFNRDVSNGKNMSNAIAVLPFANLSRSEENEYFSDGIAEELLNVLSKMKGLRVAARTSAFAFKGKQVSIEAIGRALHVRSVLEGSVRVAGVRVRIAVKLVDVENGYHLWSETYDRTMDDIFAIQDDIAHSVVGELRERLVGTNTDPNAREKVADEVARAVKGRAADPEAHRLMLLGRHLLERMNEGDAINAVGYLRQALDIDPDYALCWAQLGRAFFIASSYEWRSLDTGYENAEAALKKALVIEPDLAEGHIRLGRVRWFRDGDFTGADQCIKRALALAPNNIDVLLGASNMARELGQFEQAIDYSSRATAIDPLSPSAWVSTLYANFHSGDFRDAEPAARRALELAPQHVCVRACLALILLNRGRANEAVAEALFDAENSGWRSWALTIIHEAAGRGAESDAELGKLLTEFADGFAFQIAEAYSMRGETDGAFAWLERTFDQRDAGRFSTKVSHFLEPLHDDPRWTPLLKKIGFPD